MVSHIPSQSEALIIGGSSGIGLATAEQLARQDVNVHLVGRTESKLEDTASGLPGDGNAAYSVVDLFEDDDVTAFVEAIDQSAASLDYLINSAGSFEPKSFVNNHGSGDPWLLLFPQPTS